MEGTSVYIIDADQKIYHINYSGKRITKTEVPNSTKGAKKIFVLDKYLYILDGKKGLHVIKVDKEADSGYAEVAQFIPTGAKNI